MEAQITIEGLSPIIMHNGQTADPLNQFSRVMKKLSGKRNKTEEDLEEMSTVEWWAGLYLTEPAEIDENNTVTAPPMSRVTVGAHLLDSMIREGARKSKLGKQASAGCIVTGNGKFSYDGPANVNDLAGKPKYAFRVPVKVSTSKVMRTRPIFPVWSCVIDVELDETVIELDQIKTACEMAGKLVGIGDWRPGAPRGGYYGRFQVVKVEA